MTVRAARRAGSPGGPPPTALERLAVSHGVEVAFTDAFGAERTTPAPTLLAVLAALGVPIDRESEAPALLARDEEASRDGGPDLPAVAVAWEGRLPAVSIGPAELAPAVSVALGLEDGSDGGELVALEIRGDEAVLTSRVPLPYGRHRLAVALPGTGRAGGEEVAEVTVLSAPRRARPLAARSVALFAPTYALGDGRRRVTGDLTGLALLGRLAGRVGARYLVTLPLLAEWSSNDRAGARSDPYAPVTRLAWNEGYLDPARVPELVAGGPLSEPERHLDGLAAPAEAAAFLRPHLAEAARRLRAAGGEAAAGFERFLDAHPELRRYARFRAAAELHGPDWHHWPSSWRHGLLEDDLLPPDGVAAHEFAQFAMARQLGEIAGELHATGCGLVADLPVGSHPCGFDTWGYADSFAAGVSIGAPPDDFFRSGQDWGFRPLHPETERRTGYEVTARALGLLARAADGLRLDHAMGLARLWWIPDGHPATDGAYVRYRAEELVAVACLEAWRGGASLIGEDLGTVEASLRRLLAEHGIAGMHVAVFDLEADGASAREPLRPPAGSVALVDTHDTATFTGWFTASDIDERVRLGRLAPREAATAKSSRDRARRALTERLVATGLVDPVATADPLAVHAGLLGELGGSSAATVVVNLEDLLGEADPQNLPGSTTEHANFCRFAPARVDELDHDERVLGPLERLLAARALGGEQREEEHA